jgi:hypothetical protein
LNYLLHPKILSGMFQGKDVQTLVQYMAAFQTHKFLRKVNGRETCAYGPPLNLSVYALVWIFFCEKVFVNNELRILFQEIQW